MSCADDLVLNNPTRIRTDEASPFRDLRARFAAGRLGMMVFLASLTVLFVAGLVGYAVIRLQLDNWPRDLPRLPWVLLLSTLLLAVSSGTLQAALNSARVDLRTRAARLMAATTGLGLLFLLVQAVAWGNWFAAIGEQWPDSQAYRWALASFYVLTGIHALHVLGGLVPMVIVTVKAALGRYGARHYEGIHYCAMYWHFLGGVWIVLYLTLLIGQ